jgi:hypothetical protein
MLVVIAQNATAPCPARWDEVNDTLSLTRANHSPIPVNRSILLPKKEFLLFRLTRLDLQIDPHSGINVIPLC